MTRPGNGRATFTPARLEALKADWESGLDAEEIAQRLNRLPGDFPVSGANAVRHKATQMGLKRPEGWRLTPRLWSAARKDLLRNLINLIPDADVLERINALPGPAVKNISAMREHAQRAGYLAARPARRGPPQGTWTDERRAFLRENYGRIRPAELLERLRAMAGPPIANIKTVLNAATYFNIRRPRILRAPALPCLAHQAAKPRAILPAPAPAPAPLPLSAEEQEAVVADVLAKREEQAMRLFSQGKNATSVSAALKIPLREAFRLAGLYRQQKQEAA